MSNFFRSVKQIYLLLLITIIFISCKKNSTDVVQNNIEIPVLIETVSPIINIDLPKLQYEELPVLSQKKQGQKYQYILINQNKIELSHSTINDVEKLLGNSEITKYFEHGGEDFFWKNFTVCYYDEGRLLFHYDQDGVIFRITAYAECSSEISFLEDNIKSLVREDVLSSFNDFESGRVHHSDNAITWFTAVSPHNSTNIYDSILNYIIRFDSTGKIIWIDIYYTAPW